MTALQTITFLRDGYEDLMLWHAFGVRRDNYPDHYRDGDYLVEAAEDEGTLDNPEYIFDEWYDTKLTDPKEIAWRRLRRVGGKLYHVYRISHNIYADKKPFFSFLCCWNLAEAVDDLLTNTVGKPVIYANNVCCSLLIVPSLLPLIKEDGIYTVEYDFSVEVHDFVLVKNGDVVTVISYYTDRLYTTVLSYYKLLGLLWLIEQNTQDNRPLLSILFNLQVHIESPYHVDGVTKCYYWNSFVTIANYKQYLRNVIMPLFQGREEEQALEELSS